MSLRRLHYDSVWNALDILRDRWTFLVLRETFFGVRRFDQFQRNLGIARNILTDRLRRLEAQGMLERRLSTPFEYRLTPKGRDIYPIFLAMLHWGDTWTARPEGPPLLLFHKLCDHQMTPLVTCDHCGKEVDSHDVWYEDNPAVPDVPSLDISEQISISKSDELSHE